MSTAEYLRHFTSDDNNYDDDNELRPPAVTSWGCRQESDWQGRRPHKQQDGQKHSATEGMWAVDEGCHKDLIATTCCEVKRIGRDGILVTLLHGTNL